MKRANLKQGLLYPAYFVLDVIQILLIVFSQIYRLPDILLHPLK